MSLRLDLCRLFCEQLEQPAPSEPFSLERFDRMVQRVMRDSGIHRPGQAKTADAQVVRMFLQMTRHTYARLLSPAPEPPAELLEKARRVRECAPSTKDHYAQSRCDVASAGRRVMEVKKRVPLGAEVVVLGDDDGVSPLLAGDYRVTTVDRDSEIVDWLVGVCPQLDGHTFDVRKLPASFRGHFAAAIADPIRGFEAEWFLKAARQCLAPGGFFFWADHPDWNFAFEALKFQAEQQMELVERLENWHRYPASIPIEEDTSALDQEKQRFLKLGRLISLWSHLHIFQVKMS